MRTRQRTRSSMRWAGALTVLMVLTLSSALQADEDVYDVETGPARWGAVALDVMLIRPVSFGQTVAGSAFFVVAGPIAFVQGQDAFDVAYETFVETPADDTFKRKLGRF